jgi:hypothetical protein
VMHLADGDTVATLARISAELTKPNGSQENGKGEKK